MTQQQIEYQKMLTNKQLEQSRIDVQRTSAEAAMKTAQAAEKQANTAEARMDWDQSWGAGLEVGTSLVATVGGLLALAFL